MKLRHIFNTALILFSAIPMNASNNNSAPIKFSLDEALAKGIVEKIFDRKENTIKNIIAVSDPDAVHKHLQEFFGQYKDQYQAKDQEPIPPEVRKTMADYTDKQYLYVLVSRYNSWKTQYTVKVIDTTSKQLITEIEIGAKPEFATLVGTNLYIFHQGDHKSSTVSVIDTTSKQPVKEIKVGGERPKFVTLVGSNLYVFDYYLRTASIIDTLSNTVKDGIDVGINPQKATLVGTNLYVVNYDASTVSVIDTKDNKIKKVIKVGEYPMSTIPVGTNLYVFGNTVVIIDTLSNTVKNKLNFNVSRPVILVGTSLYSLNAKCDTDMNTVSVIDTISNKKIADIPVGQYLEEAVALGTNLYVLAAGDENSTVAVIDTKSNTKIADLPVGKFPREATIVDGNLAVVCRDGIYLIHPDKLQALINPNAAIVNGNHVHSPSNNINTSANSINTTANSINSTSNRIH